MSAIVHHAGEGERHAMGASEVVITVTGDDTGGALPAGWAHYPRELAAAAGVGGLTPALMMKIASRHDFHPA